MKLSNIVLVRNVASLAFDGENLASKQSVTHSVCCIVPHVHNIGASQGCRAGLPHYKFTYVHSRVITRIKQYSTLWFAVVS
jgi:hypothetical protein